MWEVKGSEHLGKIYFCWHICSIGSQICLSYYPFLSFFSVESFLKNIKFEVFSLAGRNCGNKIPFSCLPWVGRTCLSSSGGSQDKRRFTFKLLKEADLLWCVCGQCCSGEATEHFTHFPLSLYRRGTLWMLTGWRQN